MFLSTNSAAISNTGGIMWNNGRVYVAYVTDPAPATNALIAGVENRITIRRDGNVLEVYVNEVMVSSTTVTGQLGAWQAFGDVEAGTSKFGAGNLFRDLTYWDRKLSNSELTTLFAN